MIHANFCFPTQPNQKRTTNLLEMCLGEPGHWSNDSLLHRVQPTKYHQTLGSGSPGPINKVEAYSWKCVCLMHDAGATNKVQPESWKCVCLMHDACSSLLLNQVQPTKCNQALGNVFARPTKFKQPKYNHLCN